MGAAQDPDSAVVVRGVSKRFRIPGERVNTLKERALHPLRRRPGEELMALRDVDFSVRAGEFFGIVGRNGSGKSTLLKCLAGIYRADAGSIAVRGRLSTFIELGVGFNPDLAAADNIVLNGIMLGLTPREARGRVDDVIAFAELEEFADLKLKNYSSGMQVRLAFSVMIQVDADVLLIDEVLAVGDVAFQQKCFDVFHRIRDEGRTVLFVTHDMAAVRRFCHRALLLERGEVRLIGEPDRVSSHYLEFNFGREPDAARDTPEALERFGDLGAEIVDAWFEGDGGERRTALPQGEPCTFRAKVCFHREVVDPAFAVVFENQQHQALMATSSDWTDPTGHTGTFRPGDDALFSVSFDNVFARGRIYASPWVAYRRSPNLMDRRPRMISAVVTGDHESGGLVELPHEVTLRRPDATFSGRADLGAEAGRVGPVASS